MCGGGQLEFVKFDHLYAMLNSIVLKDRVTSHMTDEEFFWFCQENKDLRIERNSNLEIVIMAPVVTLGSFHNSQVSIQLGNWAERDGRGIVFDSSAGFALPDRSVLSPDASWVSIAKWDALSDQDKNRFAPLCPEFVIEIRSKSDELSDLKGKMSKWISNGAQLAWLLDPIEKKSYIFRPGRATEVVDGFKVKLHGESPVAGFELDLTKLRV